jgi:DNA polymerase I
MTYRTWDIETTIKASFKRKANPYDPANWTVTHGHKAKGEATVVEVRYGRERPPKGWLRPVLADIMLLIGMNIKFDLSHALQDSDNLEAWMDYVVKGGQVWDIQLAEYLLCGMGQKDQMLSLDEIAPRYGGNVKIDEVKALWNAGIDTPDIEPTLLSRYLCGGLDENGQWQQGDVENTEQVALAQIRRARECGQLNSIMLNMGALLFTVEAERNGMFVDKALGMTMAAELKIKVDELHVLLNEYIPESIYRDQFSWTSRFHKSALIFGGTVNVDDHEYDIVWHSDGKPDTILKTVHDSIVKAGQHDSYRLVYAQKDELHYLLVDGGTYDAVGYDAAVFDDPDALAGMGKAGHLCIPERQVFKAGKQAGEYKTRKVKVDNLDKPKGRAVKAPWTMPGYTVADNPAWKTSDPGVFSTAGETITELGDRDVPFLKALATLSAMVKDMGTYFYTCDEEGKEGGMLTMVNDQGIIHHMLNMVATVTARLSSSNPNLQNIPKGNKSDVKLLFKSRFKGGKIIQSDFSSLEVYVQAILTQCKQLIEDLRSGLDLHVVRLAAKEKMTYQEVFNLCKGYTDANGGYVEAIKEWDYKRTGAKVYSFQRAFGAGAKKIAASTGMAIEDVEALSAAEDERYPEIPQYYEAITLTIKGGRRPLRTLPHPLMPGVMCNIGTSAFRTPDGKLYTYVEQPAPEYLVKRGTAASFSPTEIKNYVVQGTGGEWAKAAMYLSVRAYYAQRNFGGLGLLVNQVHDAVYTDADPTVAFEAACLLHACMEAASDYMEWRFKWNIPVPVPSDTSWGDSMMDEDKIPGLKERAAVLRISLRKEFMGGYTPSYLKQPTKEST